MSRSNDDNDITLSYLIQNIWHRMDRRSFTHIIDNILNRNITTKEKEAFVLWLHKHEYNNPSCIDLVDLSKIYNFISDESVSKVIKHLDKKTYSCELECPICSNKINNAHTTECGHLFCKSCINKHIRYCTLRENDTKCPKCRSKIEKTFKVYI